MRSFVTKGRRRAILSELIEATDLAPQSVTIERILSNEQGLAAEQEVGLTSTIFEFHPLDPHAQCLVPGKKPLTPLTFLELLFLMQDQPEEFTQFMQEIDLVVTTRKAPIVVHRDSQGDFHLLKMSSQEPRDPKPFYVGGFHIQ